MYPFGHALAQRLRTRDRARQAGLGVVEAQACLVPQVKMNWIVGFANFVRSVPEGLGGD